MARLQAALLFATALAAAPATLQRPGTGDARPGAPGERGASGAEMPDSWKSGDLVRSWTSADVRATRQQEAPDLEWATPSNAARPPAAEPRRPGTERREAGRKR